MRIFECEWVEKAPPLDEAGDTIHDAAEFLACDFVDAESARAFAARQLRRGPNFYGSVHIREYEVAANGDRVQVGELEEIS